MPKSSKTDILRMARQADRRQTSVWRSIDWLTIIIYIALLSFGWVSVCGASYSYGETDIFSLATRSGMQIVWIGTSIMLGFIILMLDDRFYDTFAYIIYGLLLLLLLPLSLIRIASKAPDRGWYWGLSDCNPQSLPSLPQLWRWLN